MILTANLHYVISFSFLTKEIYIIKVKNNKKVEI